MVGLYQDAGGGVGILYREERRVLSGRSLRSGEGKLEIGKRGVGRGGAPGKGFDCHSREPMLSAVDGEVVREDAVCSVCREDIINGGF